MAKKAHPKTRAIRCLEQHKIPFEIFSYAYEERGGTQASSKALGVDEHCVIKTLIMETNTKVALIVLMHGDLEVSTKQLARILGVKSVTPCTPQQANKHSGYVVGGTSPWGTRRPMDVYAEQSLFDLERIYINGGQRGLLVRIDPQDLHKALHVTVVQVGI
jgi:Cys-tRNA(Pro) deacylase